MTAVRGRTGPVSVVMLLMLAGLSIAPARARDVYIGTVTVDGERATLERCDLGRTRYALSDAAPGGAVDDLRARPLPASGFWYAEVIGDYVEMSVDDDDVVTDAPRSGHGLSVIAIEGLREGASCHLLDHLEALDAAEAADTSNTPAR